MQGLQDEGECVLLAHWSRPAQRILQVRLRHPRGLEQRLAVHELRERRARRDACGTAVDFVADLCEAVFLDPEGKTGDIAARGVSRLPDAARGVDLADIVGLYKVVYCLWVVVSHQLSAVSIQLVYRGESSRSCETAAENASIKPSISSTVLSLPTVILMAPIASFLSRPIASRTGEALWPAVLEAQAEPLPTAYPRASKKSTRPSRSEEHTSE